MAGQLPFAAATLRAAFEAARCKRTDDRSACAAVVAVLLPHVDASERTVSDALITLDACIDDPGAVEAIADALVARAPSDGRLGPAVARAARRAFELRAAGSLLVLVDVLLANPAGALLVEDDWGAAVFGALSELGEGAAARLDRVRRRWAEHRKTRPPWLGELDDEKTDLHPPSFFRARHAELLAIGASGAGERSVGRYRLVEEIGAGGMGTVHLARLDGCQFARWVAIKRLHPYIREEEAYVQLFLDEARLTASIMHPNVASILELGKSDEGYWIAMEYLHGEPLAEWLRRARAERKPVPPEIACRIIADAAAGLHAAHGLVGPGGKSLDVVHRDVTPQNVFVTFDGITKVLDFGLATLSAVDRETSSYRGPRVAGKLSYMAPEQIRGERIDRRADVFALGVVLWELTTGRRLFRRDSELDTLKEVLDCAPPAPSTVVAGYPADLERTVMKALAKDPADRFQTARELYLALRTTLQRRRVIVGSEEVGFHARALLADRLRVRQAMLARYASSRP